VPAGCGPDVTFRRKKIPAWPLFWIAADPLAADREEWTSGSGAKARIARFDVKDVTLCKGSNRRGGRVAEGARLESVFTGNRNVGSNPTPSANPCSAPFFQQKQGVMAMSSLALVTGFSYSDDPRRSGAIFA
jgi:hypothetical protein